jgi:hypothetical protein
LEVDVEDVRVAAAAPDLDADRRKARLEVASLAGGRAPPAMEERVDLFRVARWRAIIISRHAGASV